ncbi:MAG TPA: GNAT family N-acetyltransferase [Bacilli bacterium]|nr:GNAT family N-acetyltransferase [Bacilli bacterium]
MQAQMRYRLDRLNQADIPSILLLSQAMGWDYHEAELQTIFSSGIVYGHRAEEGQLVSSAAILPYEGKVASLGLVMVHPEHRRKGLGEAMTQRVIDALPDRSIPIMLIATDEGKSLYERMGFRTVETTHKFIAERYRVVEEPQVPSGYEVKAMTQEHISDVLALDAGAMGARREAFLHARIKQAREGVVLVSQGAVVGYGLSILSLNNQLNIGSIVAPDSVGAIALIHSLAKDWQCSIRIDVPSEKEDLCRHLSASGFEAVRIPPTMVMNADRIPHRNGKLHAIAAQIFG